MVTYQSPDQSGVQKGGRTGRRLRASKTGVQGRI